MNPPKNAYLFILCPPLSGSTILVSTSDAVSSLPCEGQNVRGVKKLPRPDRWNSAIELPWAEIKRIWERHWDKTRPLLLEKSPPHVIRVPQIMEHFDPIYCIVMVRNPYAHCEGLMRRLGWSPVEAAELSLHCMRQQIENVRMVPRCVRFTYEEMADDPAAVSRKIRDFLPAIGELKHDDAFESHSIDGVLKRTILNLNAKKIRNLSPSDLRAISAVLKTAPEVMHYWGYEFLDPDLHFRTPDRRVRAGSPGPQSDRGRTAPIG